MTLPLVIAPDDTGHISDHEEIHALLTDAVSPFLIALDAQGLIADRPAAGRAGRFYVATDEGIIYRDNGAAWEELSDHLNGFIGNLLQGFTTMSGIRVPAARLSKSVDQAIATATDTTISFQQETGGTAFDNDDMHSVSSQTARLTVRRKGGYLYIANIEWGNNATGERVISLFKNGTSRVARDDRLASSGLDSQTVAIIAAMDVNDWMEVKCNQTSGGNLDVRAGSRFCGAWLTDL